MKVIKQYLRLAKPGVMLGNLITTVAGFLFASQGHIDLRLFFVTAVGTGLVISSACVINNVLDQDIDARMERTKTRPLITGEANGTVAALFGASIGIIGLIILLTWTNIWVTGVGIFGFITYVWLYGALSKRKSIHGTLVGSLSGAAPILAGYVAVQPGLGIPAVLLFLILFFWQLPEFYSIAIYRQKEYAAAGVPVISVMKSIPFTIRSIFAYTLLFIASTIALFVFGHTSISYLVVMTVLNLRWLQLAYEGLHSKKPAAWARRMFRYSLIMLLAFSFLISVDNFLP